MLIYEYMPNKSLDFLLFDRTGSTSMDWRIRHNIILGIARGVLYLHQDSIIRIVHRDLKASNILLDASMNPKISDFGMARIFGGNQTEGNTNRVVGTFGYMSPEYAMDGLFSAKSDVFSFGVLLLEIISGKKNTGFYCEDPSMNLIKHAWKLWRDGTPLELVDHAMGASFPEQEVVKFIQVGILCVQENADWWFATTDLRNLEVSRFKTIDLIKKSRDLDGEPHSASGRLVFHRGELDAPSESLGILVRGTSSRK
ncbi:hypothetical protein Syun_027153 [Stephania yunnanensis]|uniref:Protein kinase domain-containing protein n=1 Tax=Stephania yunnanensis TaxID=152371 RepID=A0AAP0EIG7_9MAGN